jgi:uncharacterized protein YuzE
LADALYVNFAEGKVGRTEEIKPGMLLDYDTNGNVWALKFYVSANAQVYR